MSAGADSEEVPLTRVRRLTAQRLSASAQQAPHFYLTRVVDAYRNYMKMPYDRQTWDLTAVLYGMRPDGGYFSLSPYSYLSHRYSRYRWWPRHPRR